MGRNRRKANATSASSSGEVALCGGPKVSFLAVKPLGLNTAFADTEDAAGEPGVPDTMPLEHYIRKALPKRVRNKLPPHLFRPSESIKVPTLRKNRLNPVLIFPGSFNPPHIGHKIILAHAFLCSTYGKIIAAIIQPVPTRKIRGKDHLEPKLLFDHAERTRLCHDDMLNPWSWVAPPLKKLGLYKKLFTMTRDDGFPIAFVNLSGTDYCDGQSDAHEDWEAFNQTIFVHYLRPGYFDGTNGSLEPLQGGSDWKRDQYAEHPLLKRIKAGEFSAIAVLHLLNGNKVKKSHRSKGGRSGDAEIDARACLEQYLKNQVLTWCCYRKNESGQSMQYMVVREAKDRIRRVEVSSTAIRKILQDHLRYWADLEHGKDGSRYGAVEILRDVALNVDVLLDIVEAKERKANSGMIRRKLYKMAHQRMDAKAKQIQQRLEKEAGLGRETKKNVLKKKQRQKVEA
jgi:hypothetical protein